jgi:beta-mannosidase
MIRQSLHEGWTLVAPLTGVPDALRGRDIPAIVPGCVHTDLLAGDQLGCRRWRWPA